MAACSVDDIRLPCKVEQAQWEYIYPYLDRIFNVIGISPEEIIVSEYCKFWDIVKTFNGEWLLEGNDMSVKELSIILNSEVTLDTYLYDAANQLMIEEEFYGFFNKGE